MRPILPAKGGFCKDVLSVIVIILPSEKSRRSPGRCCKCLKSAALIDPDARRYKNSAARRRQEAVTFLTEIYPLSGLVGAMILQAGFDD